MNALDYLKLKPHPVDETDLPRWGTAPDGRYTDITTDDRFAELFALWQADACQHERTGIVEWVNGGGQTCFNWHCAYCGLKLSSNVPHALARKHGVVDAHLDGLASRSNKYVGERQTRLEALKAAAAERAQPGNREEYDDYLRSERWRALRSKILQRARGVCEGCLSNPAEHVHHLSYEHRGNEFAWELRAVCSSCHERIHHAEAINGD